MTTTTAHGLPIPEETDPLGETDERIVELAEFIDAELFSPRVITGDDVTAALGLVESPPPATFIQIRRDGHSLVTTGRLVQLTLSLQFQTAPDVPFPVPPSGDIGNVICPFQLTKLRPLVAVGGYSGASSGRNASFALTADGTIYLAAVAGGAIPTNENFTASFTYIRGA